MSIESFLTSVAQRSRWTRHAVLAVLVIVGGCAGASVRDSQDFGFGFQGRPSQIVVYDFSYAPEQEPGIKSHRALTPEEEAIGRQVSAIVAAAIIVTLERETDISTVAASSAGLPPDGSLVIEGEFLSIEEGSALGRMLVGFGAGRSELVTRSQVFYIDDGRKQLINEYELKADSGAAPGLALGAGMGAATGDWALQMGLAAGGVAANVVIGNNTVADAQRTGEELAKEMIKAFELRGWL